MMIKRILRIFDRTNEHLLDEALLTNISLPEMQRAFDTSESNLMYDCYPVQTWSERQYVESVWGYKVQHELYDYFIEADDDD